MKEESSHYELFQSELRRRFEHEPHLHLLVNALDLSKQLVNAAGTSQWIEHSDGFLHLNAIDGAATFGYLKWPSDESELPAFWQKVLDAAKQMGVTKLVGPMHGSTFFPYRFVVESDGSEFFPGEYFSEVTDHRRMMSLAPSMVHYFRSGFRNHFDGIMAVSEPYYEKARKDGLRVTNHTKVSGEVFQQVMPLVTEIFGKNLGFKSLKVEQVQSLLKVGEPEECRLRLQCIWRAEELIGFCRFVEHDANTLVCKTLGLKPEYQGKGYGNAVVYEMHKAAMDAAYSRMIYALIYDHNRVQQNMPKDDSVIFRRYASYEFDLQA